MGNVGSVLAAVVLTASTVTLAAPADAGTLAWHTVLTNREARFQACKRLVGYDAFRQQDTYEVSWRVNNRRGTRWVQFKETTSDDGVTLGSGSIPWVAPHTRKGPIAHSPEYDTSVAQLSTRYGHHRRQGTVTVAAIGAC